MPGKQVIAGASLLVACKLCNNPIAPEDCATLTIYAAHAAIHERFFSSELHSAYFGVFDKQRQLGKNHEVANKAWKVCCLLCTGSSLHLHQIG